MSEFTPMQANNASFNQGLRAYQKSLYERDVDERVGTTTLTIQKFQDIYAIIGSHVDPSRPFEPVAPGGVMYVDEKSVKKMIIAEFEKLGAATISCTDLGIIMYNYFIPEGIRDHLRTVSPANLVIMTPSEHDIPWEFMYNGNDFWCTSYNMGRVLIENLTRTYTPKPIEQKLRIAVIVSDPLGNLPSVQKEGEKIKELLGKDPSIEVDMFEKTETSKLNVLRILTGGNYDVIHYAGHAAFDSGDPTKSYLKLFDGDFTINEISRLRFPESFRPIIFANACQTSKSEFVGDKLVSLASAFANAGALAYIGTMWPVGDTLAADFASAFYSNLKSSPIGVALKSARLELRNRSEKLEGWVPYALFGDPARKIRKATSNFNNANAAPSNLK